ncbi:MAG: SpoIVB peptidase S55 domain-containing protein [Candidatus Rifleibacteriota bacterium]
MNLFKRILTIILVLQAGFLGAVDEIMPLHEVKLGMKGMGKTVVRGRQIEPFDVEVLGLLTNNKVNENMLINGNSVLVKVSGEAIEKAGGIAAGMSGSPVYIDGKLVGGISSGWVMTDHTVGLVTPIEEMLKILDYPDLVCKPGDTDEVEWVLKKPVKLNNRIINKIIEVNSVSENVKTEPQTLLFKRAAAEVFVEGIDGRAFNYFKKKAEKRKMKLVQNYPGHYITEEKEEDIPPPASGAYEPGSPIGIQLARGDINLSTLGTLTYRNKNRILMLAHSFLKKGNVNYLMTGAHIHHSFASVQMPFKIGAPTEMLGIITQDREKGLAGEIGRMPKMVPVQLDVFEKDLGISKSINYQIVRDPSVFKMTLETTLFQALEGVIDRAGGGTAVMGISLDCANKDGEQYNFRRENMFYSKSDIVQTLVSELTNLTDMVIDSEIEAVLPTRLILNIEIEKKRKTVSIEKVEIKNSSISSGGVLDVEITLKPFREKSFIRRVKLPIPQELGRESLTLSVYGLNMKIDDTNMFTENSETRKEIIPGEPVSLDFDSAVRSWANSPKNSDLLFHLTLEGDEMRKIKLNGRDIEIQPTNLVVTGRVDTTLTLSEE